MTTSKSVQRRLTAQGVLVISPKARLGPIAGRGIIFLVDREVAEGLKVGDKVMPEFEETLYTVHGFEFSTHGALAGVVVGRPVAEGSAVQPEDV